MAHNPLYVFLLKAVLWLPVCLGLWYWKAEWFNWPAAMMAGWTMQSLFSGWVQSVEWSGRVLGLATTLKLATPPGMPVGEYAAMLEANPLAYGYGLPLFVALSLASGGEIRWRKLALGAALLVLFPVWGICLDFLKQAAVGLGPTVTAQAGFMSWQVEAIALGYQFGALILPTMAPIALWLAFNRSFIPMLMLEGVLRRQLP